MSGRIVPFPSLPPLPSLPPFKLHDVGEGDDDDDNYGVDDNCRPLKRMKESESDSLATAATPRPTTGKKQATLSVLFTAQFENISKRIQFITDNAPDTIPLGYLRQLQEVENLTAEMNSAADEYIDYDLAAELKLKRDDIASTVALEKKLFNDCTWAQTYAKEQIQKHRKLENFPKCKQFENLLNIATSYLDSVSDDDAEGLMFSPCDTPVATSSPATSFEPDSQATSINMEGRNDDVSVGDKECLAGVFEGEDEPLKKKSGLASGFWRNGDDDDDDNNNDNDDDDDDDEVELPLPTTKPKAKAARERAPKQYISASADCTPKVVQKPPSLDKFRKFISNTCFNIKTAKGKPQIKVNMTNEPYILSFGYLYCNCCKKQIHWNNRGKHVTTQSHMKAKKGEDDMAVDLDRARPMVQQRIMDKKLVGKTYSKDKIDGTMSWLKIACAGNWSLKSVEDNRVSNG